MKIDQKALAIILVLLVDCLVGGLVFSKTIGKNDTVLAKSLNNNLIIDVGNKIAIETLNVSSATLIVEHKKASIVYDNMTLDELSIKLEKSMNSTLEGKGKLFATYTTSLGLDPYLALAIVLQETGCSHDCSNLVKQCNNIGGLKGNPGCNGGSYMDFSSIDEGIKGYLDIIYKGYYSKGLTTPEEMNPKYAASTTWATKVNWYIKQIKAK